MIEYVYNAIRATAGETICICANITDDEGQAILYADVNLMLYDNETMLASIPGVYVTDAWEFEIDGRLTSGLCGRFWYCICADNNSLCFKQPIYIIQER